MRRFLFFFGLLKITDRSSCIAAMTIEFDACSHGSEQDHGNFHYTLDPNAGAC
jgi:hypothetical protein